MKIGDIQIDPLIDGGLALPGPSFYTNTTDAAHFAGLRWAKVELEGDKRVWRDLPA